MQNTDHNLWNYDYTLPENLIAQTACQPAHKAKLLLCKPKDLSYELQNYIFEDLTKLLDSNSVLFLNSTKVFKARIKFSDKIFYRTSTNPPSYKKINWEIFVYKIIDSNNFECLVSDNKNFKPENKIFRSDEITLEIKKLTKNWVVIEIIWENTYDFLQNFGQMPLPPYISYDQKKEIDYQTHFAKEFWSSACPTASLHFTSSLIKKLKASWVEISYEVLHVGLWTFKPVFCDNISQHKIHEEEMLVKLDIFEKIMEYIKLWKTIVAVWTTMARYLESLPYIWKIISNKSIFSDEVQIFWDDFSKNIKQNSEYIRLLKQEKWFLSFATKLFIYPDFEWRIVNQLITNFHLPKSSLMMLVASFMWRENLLKAYNYAIQENYKFYSFWDGMWIQNQIKI